MANRPRYSLFRGSLNDALEQTIRTDERQRCVRFLQRLSTQLDDPLLQLALNRIATRLSTTEDLES